MVIYRQISIEIAFAATWLTSNILSKLPSPELYYLDTRRIRNRLPRIHDLLLPLEGMPI